MNLATDIWFGSYRQVAPLVGIIIYFLVRDYIYWYAVTIKLIHFILCACAPVRVCACAPVRLCACSMWVGACVRVRFLKMKHRLNCFRGLYKIEGNQKWILKQVYHFGVHSCDENVCICTAKYQYHTATCCFVVVIRKNEQGSTGK